MLDLNLPMLRSQLLDAFVEALANRSTAKAIQQMTTRFAKLFSIHSVAFLKQFATFQDRFTESVSSDELDSAFDFSALNDQMIAIIQDFIEKGLTYGAEALIAQFDVDTTFSLENSRAVAYTEDYAATRVTQLNDASKAELRNVLARGVDNGWSYNRIARAIKDVFNTFSSKRAHLIAVTEIGNAYQAGNMIVALDLRDSGLAIEKSWLTVGDDRVDPDCKANEDEGYIPVDQAHSSGVQHPLAHPRCRCVERYRRVKPSAVNTESKQDVNTTRKDQDIPVETVDRSKTKQSTDDANDARLQHGDGGKLHAKRKRSG